jgi:RHS repeat-associated protein
VLAVVDSDGDVVCQYDYMTPPVPGDSSEEAALLPSGSGGAAGNLREDNSFETVPNRYRFHGREWGEHRGDYYYRYRTCVPEWGRFTSPDMQFDPMEGEGTCNYLFCGNDPVSYLDPIGTWPTEAGRGQRRLLTPFGFGDVHPQQHPVVFSTAVHSAVALSWAEREVLPGAIGVAETAQGVAVAQLGSPAALRQPPPLAAH